MKRRTFLKALFAVAVAPASAVKVLYEPEKIPSINLDESWEWKNYTFEYQPKNSTTHTHYMQVPNGCNQVVYYEGPEPLTPGTMVYYSDPTNKIVKSITYREGLEGNHKFDGIIGNFKFSGQSQIPLNIIEEKMRAALKATNNKEFIIILFSRISE